jgi:hypothetical protein
MRVGHSGRPFGADRAEDTKFPGYLIMAPNGMRAGNWLSITILIGAALYESNPRPGFDVGCPDVPDCAVAARIIAGRAICLADATEGTAGCAICPGSVPEGVVPASIIAGAMTPEAAMPPEVAMPLEVAIPGVKLAIVSIRGGWWFGNGAIAPATGPTRPGSSGGDGFAPAFLCSSGHTDVTFTAYGSPSHGLPEW